MATEVKLPELAEGVEKGDIVNVLVKEGQQIEVDTPIVELESEKATVTVPSPVAGKVSKVEVQAGQTVKTGQTLITVETGAGAEAAPKEAAPGAEPVKRVEPLDKHYDEDTTAMEKSHPEAAPEAARRIREMPAAGREHPAPGGAGAAPSREVLPAGPAVRRLARELGVDLRQVHGSGPRGRINLEDLDPYVQGYVTRRAGISAPPRPAAAGAPPPAELPDFSAWGPVRSEKVESLRRKIAEKMAQSWASVPHVHQFAEADITELMALQKRYRDRVREMGAPLTITPFLLKALVTVLKEFPKFNASYNPASEELIFKEYYHLGVAVDTPQGLIVPVLRDVDKKPIVELAVELSQLAQRTRERKISLEELRGGTFTLSNLGGIGGGAFTPIINTPEVAILGTSRAQRRPVYTSSGQIEPRDLMPICLGYDHRVIDGAEGARFIVRLTQVLENFEATFLGF